MKIKFHPEAEHGNPNGVKRNLPDASTMGSSRSKGF